MLSPPPKIIDKRALSAYDDSSKRWMYEPGEFKVLIGSSSRDIRQKGELRAVGKNIH
jgi:beta-glucosidase